MIPVIYFEELKVGDRIPPLTKDPISEIQLVRYAGASGDFNPLHFDPSIGEAAGFGGVIAHGMLIMGFMGEAITNWIPNHFLRKFKARFIGITRLKDTITITGRVIEKKDSENKIICSVAAKDQNGELKIKGTFEAQLPSRNYGKELSAISSVGSL
jgi:acyl dehydratase